MISIQFQYLKLLPRGLSSIPAVPILAADTQPAKTRTVMQPACACPDTSGLRPTVDLSVQSMQIVPTLCPALDKNAKILVLAFAVKMLNATSKITMPFVNVWRDTSAILSLTVRRNPRNPEILAFPILAEGMLFLGSPETGAYVNVTEITLAILSLDAEGSVKWTGTVPLIWLVKITSASILANVAFVVSMLNALCKITMPFALALMASLEIPSPDAILVSYSLVAWIFLSTFIF